MVHRPRQADWSLPKGKLDPGESWQQTALREVTEETGWTATLGRFAGAKLCMARPRPKLVLYWHMRAVGEEGGITREVDEVAWLSRRDAVERLSSEADRRLLTLALAGEAWRSAEPQYSVDDFRRLLIIDGPCQDPDLARVLGIVAWAALAPVRPATPSAISSGRPPGVPPPPASTGRG